MNIKELTSAKNSKTDTVFLNLYTSYIKSIHTSTGINLYDDAFFTSHGLLFMRDGIEAMLLYAANLGTNAAYNGAYHDGGADRVVGKIQALLEGAKMGVSKQLVGELKEADMLMKFKDSSDYEQYKALYKKFNGTDPN